MPTEASLSFVLFFNKLRGAWLIHFPICHLHSPMQKAGDAMLGGKKNAGHSQMTEVVHTCVASEGACTRQHGRAGTS